MKFILMTREKKKASAIIVCHNNKDVLSESLGALKNQTFKDFNIYLIDNHSTDGTEEFIKKNYPKIHFLQGIKSVSTRRNYGID